MSVSEPETAIPPREEEFRTWLLVGVFALPLLLWRFRSIAQEVEPFRFDDTFITLRYAHNLAAHGHFSFNLHDHVDGYTSPGWTLLLALIERLGGNPERAVYALSKFCGVLCLPFTAWIARLWRAPALLAWSCVGALLLTNPGFVLWSLPGMETSFAALCGLVLLTSFAAPATTTRQRAVRAIALVAASLARPDLWVPVALLFAWEFRGFAPETLREKWSVEKPSLRALAWPIGATVLLMLWFAWRWKFYGYPLPNTYYAKRGNEDLAVYGVARLFDLTDHLGIGPLPLLSIGVLAFGKQLSREARYVAFAVGLWLLGCVWTYTRAGDDYVPQWRFYQPVLPLVFASFAGALGIVVRAIATNEKKRWGLAAGISLLWLLGSFARYRQFEGEHNTSIWVFQQNTLLVQRWEQVAEVLRRAFPPSTRLAVKAAGVIPYRTGFETFDQHGLNQTEVAHGPVADSFPGHSRIATPAQVLAARPDIILDRPHLQPRPGIIPPAKDEHTRAYERAGYRSRCIPLPNSNREVCFWAR